MRLLARWHIWLGWAIGVPLLMWTVSGLVMVARPIEAVRGEHLLREPAAAGVDVGKLMLPQVREPVVGARLVQQGGRATWIVTTGVDEIRRYSALDGQVLPPITREEAGEVARERYLGSARLARITHFSAAAEPLDLRRGRPSWRAEFTDGTRVYVDAETGEFLAIRTRWWRLFDVMYGLHIMDLQTRENSHHPLLIGFAGMAVVGSLIGCVLLFRRRKARPVAPVADAPALAPPLR